MRALALLLAVPLVLAGCISVPAQEVDPAASVSAAMLVVRDLLDDVPCEANVVDEGTSENLLGLALKPPTVEGTHGELDARGDLLLVARYSAGGFEVLDLSDPLALRPVGEFLGESTAYDVKWMPRGDTAILGLGGGVQLVDMRDPSNPALLHDWKFSDEGLTGSAHMVDAHLIAGEEWVFIAPNSDQGVYILQREGDRLVYKASYKHPVLGGGPLGPHDMTVLDDELLGKPVLYVANGFEGWLAADVSDPASPVHLGGFVNPDPAQGYLHTIQAEKVGERRLVATVQEVGVNAVKVWDATDLQKPVLLAMWFADKTRPQIPNHNLQLLDGLLYVAHYEKGVYVFDLTKVGATPYAESASFAPIAHYAVDFEPADDTTGQVLALSNVWDVVVKDGLLYVGDVKAGVHTVGFGCLTPGDAAQTSRG